MKISRLNAVPFTAALIFGLLIGMSSAAAQTFNVQYFEVPTGTPDFFNGTSTSGSSNFVLPTLGPDDLPVYNPAYATTFGLLLPPNSTYLNSSNELLYWTAGAGSVTKDGSPTTIALSSTPVNMFAPGTGGVDSAFESTAVLTDTFAVAPGTPDNMTFTVDADDNAYVYVFPTGNPTTANSLVDSIGGIHTVGSPQTSTTIAYGSGSYTIEIFYADRDISLSQLAFSETQNIVGAPSSVTPEPSTFVLLGTGLLALAGALRRRFTSQPCLTAR